MGRRTVLLVSALAGVSVVLLLVSAAGEIAILRLLGSVESDRLATLTTDPDIVRALVPLIGLSVARVLLLLGMVVAATGAVAPERPEDASAVLRPVRPEAAAIRPAAVVFWVFGLVLFVGGGTGHLVAFVADSEDDATYARQLRELDGEAGGSAAAAEQLQNRADQVAEALDDLVASSEDRVSARNALVDAFNTGVEERNISGTVDIAGTELPERIERYQRSVTDLEQKEAALALAVARLQETAP